MAKLWDLLSPLSKVNLARLYERLKEQEGYSGVKFTPPEEEKEQPQIESLEEMTEIMQETPHYTISQEGRH